MALQSLDLRRPHFINLCSDGKAEKSSSEVDSKRDPGELPLPTYGQTLSTCMDERHKNLPPELGKHSSTQKAENIALKKKKKGCGKELLAGKASYHCG